MLVLKLRTAWVWCCLKERLCGSKPTEYFRYPLCLLLSFPIELNVLYTVNIHIFPLLHQEHDFYQFFLPIPIVM